MPRTCFTTASVSFAGAAVAVHRGVAERQRDQLLVALGLAARILSTMRRMGFFVRCAFFDGLTAQAVWVVAALAMLPRGRVR